MYNTMQQYAIQHSRLHIPIEYGADAVHGHNNVLGATIFPQQIGVGATWDTALAKQLGQSTQKAVAATGVTWDFAPVADISRDQRWGRYYETYARIRCCPGRSRRASSPACRTSRVASRSRPPSSTSPGTRSRPTARPGAE